MESALGDYLRARRDGLRPDDVGVVAGSGRRVEGLRRDEVARRAGISPEYYLRLEQGRGHQPSDQVLRALARALNLDEYALQYMTRLSRFDSRVTGEQSDRPAVASERRLAAAMDLWRASPAFITDRNQTVVSSNEGAGAIFPGGLQRGANMVLRVFSRAWRDADLDWERTAARAVAALRFSGDPGDPHFRDLVGLLAMRDSDFPRLWARQDAAPLAAADIAFEIEGRGPARFRQQALRPAGDEDHVVSILHVDSGSAASLLASSRGWGSPDAVDVRRAG